MSKMVRRAISCWSRRANVRTQASGFDFASSRACWKIDSTVWWLAPFTRASKMRWSKSASSSAKSCCTLPPWEPSVASSTNSLMDLPWMAASALSFLCSSGVTSMEMRLKIDSLQFRSDRGFGQSSSETFLCPWPTFCQNIQNVGNNRRFRVSDWPFRPWLTPASGFRDHCLRHWQVQTNCR